MKVAHMKRILEKVDSGNSDKLTAAQRVFFEENERMMRKMVKAADAEASEELDAEEEQSADDLVDEQPTETKEQIYKRIKERFDALDRLGGHTVHGDYPALIVSGPGGLGKSWAIMRALANREREDETFRYDHISGALSPVGLYTSAFNYRNPGDLLVFDDCDDVFEDTDSLNILKTMLDSNKDRYLSWNKMAKWMEELGIEKKFKYEGSVVFLTNVDFDRKINSNKSNATHYRALVDRCLYLNLTIRTATDFMVRLEQVIYEEKMLEAYGLTKKEIDKIVAYIYEHRNEFRHLSLRLVHSIATMFLKDRKNWEIDVRMTKMRAA